MVWSCIKDFVGKRTLSLDPKSQRQWRSRWKLMSHARNWREIFQPEGEKQQHVFLFNAKLRWARAQLPESELKTYLKSAGFWLIYSNKWTSSSTKISISSRRHSTALVFELALVWDKCFSSSGYPVRFLTSSGTKFPLSRFPYDSVSWRTSKADCPWATVVGLQHSGRAHAL